MRLSLFVFFIISVGYNTNKLQSNPLNGTWIPVQQEIAGTPLPKSSFEKQKLTIADSTYVFSAESVDKGALSYQDGKMDIYGKEGVNTGKHFTATYKLENGELFICYNLAGNGYPIGFETKGQEAYFLSIYKKE